MALLLDEPAVFRRPDGVVRVTGAERVDYLHTLLSQDLASASPGAVADFLYLDAKGNALAAGRAIVHAEAVFCVVPSGVAGDFAEALERFKFLMDVVTEDVSEQWAVASVHGPERVDLTGARSEPMTAAPHGDGLVVRDRTGGVDLVGRKEWVDDRVAGLGLPEASLPEWDAWRIANAIPGWGSEIGPGRRPQELGLLPTHVHLRKGCYPGQESIAKTYNLGRPRRSLVLAELDGPTEPGARLHAADRPGEVTSSARVGERWLALVLLPIDPETGEVAGDGALAGDGVRGRALRRVGADVPIPGAEQA